MATATKAITLKPIQRKLVRLTIRGTSTLIQHQWSAKAKKMILDKKQGKKTKEREICDPEKEAEEATYRTADGEYGIPVSALKSAIITAAHKDLGIEKTLVCKALFIQCDDPGGVLAMECDEPELGEDTVRVGQGGADLRYRPYFHRWRVPIVCEIDSELLKVEDLITLINRAGFGTGIGEMRPEKKKDYGRFEVDTTVPVEEETAS